MKITSIELETDIDIYIREKIINYHKKYHCKPKVIILSKPLLNWFKKIIFDKYYFLDYGTQLPDNNITFEGINIIETFKDNIIEVY